MDVDDTQISNTGTSSTSTLLKNIRVAKLKIMLNTNIPSMSSTTPLQFSMLSHPDLEKGRFSATKYTVPYFTDTVKYPMDVLSIKAYSDRVDFFFNKTRFIKILRKTMYDYVDDIKDVGEEIDKKHLTVEEEDEIIKKHEKVVVAHAKRLHENADHNIKTMLILLFPIADELGNVFKTSYDQYILNRPSDELYTLRNIDPVTFLNPSSFPLYNYFAKRVYEAPITEVSYLNISNTKYLVTDVIWQNDLINHPIYRDFVSVYYDKIQEKRNSSQKIKAELRERRKIFQLLFTGTLLTDSDAVKAATATTAPAATAPNPPQNVFEKMMVEIDENISGNSSVQYNPEENMKRNVVAKIKNSLNRINYIIYTADIKAPTLPLTTQTITREKASANLRGEVGDLLLDSIIDNIINAYIDFTTYNEQAKGAMKLTLKDNTRVLTELYNSAILLKTVKLLMDFVTDKIRRLDLSEKNDDGSAKTKLELDILRVLKKNYIYYSDLNTSIVSRLKDVIEPTRKSPNIELQTFLKRLAMPSKSKEEDPDKNMLIDIYDTYISNIRYSVKRAYIEKYMNVGVSTVKSTQADTNTPANKDAPPTTKDTSESLFSGEMPEIYVYINVVKKDEYEKNEGRRCAMSDDRIANNLKQVLYSNTMLNDSFPEMNLYRSYKFMEEPAKEKDPNHPNPPTNDQKGIAQQNPEVGARNGGKRSTRKYIYNRRRRTHRR